jgi:hypothetical protein
MIVVMVFIIQRRELLAVMLENFYETLVLLEIFSFKLGKNKLFFLIKMTMNTNGLQKHVAKNGMKILVIKITIKHFRGVLIYKQIENFSLYIFLI